MRVTIQTFALADGEPEFWSQCVFVPRDGDRAAFVAAEFRVNGDTCAWFVDKEYVEDLADALQVLVDQVRCQRSAGSRWTGATQALEGLLHDMYEDAPAVLDIHGAWRTDLPTFGGEPLDGCEEVWSWDPTHVIVGACHDSLRIVPREEVQP